MSDIQAVLCGYYGMGNGGDEALLVSLLQMLPPQVKPIVLSGNPPKIKKSKVLAVGIALQHQICLVGEGVV